MTTFLLIGQTKVMKNIENVIGIDVSKLKFDAWDYRTSRRHTFSNDVKGFVQFSKWMTNKDSFVCFENTGYYSLALAVFLLEQHIVFAMVSPLQIKRSLGLVRGKNDVIDAGQIARYGWLHREELEPSAIPAKIVLELSQLLHVREQLVKQKVALDNMLEAYEQLPNMGSKAAIKLLKLQLKQTCQHIKKAEEAIDQLLTQTDLVTNYELLSSIKGVGRILAAQIIVHTNNFESFDNWRQFACYAGLAPFPYQSGTSIKGRTKVHPIADKKLKRLFNMAALSGIQHDPELKLYFQRKVQQGKSKMCVLNAVRCKILARAFAVVHRQTPFVPLCGFAA